MLYHPSSNEPLGRNWPPNTGFGGKVGGGGGLVGGGGAGVFVSVGVGVSVGTAVGVSVGGIGVSVGKAVAVGIGVAVLGGVAVSGILVGVAVCKRGAAVGVFTAVASWAATVWAAVVFVTPWAIMVPATAAATVSCTSTSVRFGSRWQAASSQHKTTKKHTRFCRLIIVIGGTSIIW